MLLYYESLYIKSWGFSGVFLFCSDKFTQLNSSLFNMNGGTGYVLQPELMRSDTYDPQQEKKTVKFTLSVRVGLKFYYSSVNILAFITHFPTQLLLSCLLAYVLQFSFIFVMV